MRLNFVSSTTAPETCIKYYKRDDDYFMEIAYKDEHIQYVKLGMPRRMWFKVIEAIDGMLKDNDL